MVGWRWLLGLVVVAGSAGVVVPALGAAAPALPGSAVSSSDPDFAAGLRLDKARRERLGGLAAKETRRLSRARFKGRPRRGA